MTTSRALSEDGRLKKAFQRAIVVFCGLFVFTTILVSCSPTLASVTSITAIPNLTSLDISWEAVPGASGYEVFLSTSPQVSPTNYSTSVAVSTTSTSITGLTVGNTYYLVITPTSLYGFSSGPASQVMAVNLTGQPASAVPVITAITASPDPASVGSTVLFAASASVTNGDTLYYTWTVTGPTSMTVGPTANLNQYTWNATTAGSYTLSVTVTDNTPTPPETATASTNFSVQ